MMCTPLTEVMAPGVRRKTSVRQLISWLALATPASPGREGRSKRIGLDQRVLGLPLGCPPRSSPWPVSWGRAVYYGEASALS